MSNGDLRILVQVPPDLLEWADDYARQTERSRAAVVRFALERLRAQDRTERSHSQAADEARRRAEHQKASRRGRANQAVEPGGR